MKLVCLQAGVQHSEESSQANMLPIPIYSLSSMIEKYRINNIVCFLV